jgi:hypothetical protein
MKTSQELLDKVGKLFLSKAKTKKIDIDFEFGKGQIVVTGVHSITKYGRHIFLEVNVKYVTIEKKSSYFVSDKTVGEIRNIRIKKIVEWDKNNDIALLKKVMGITNINVNNITVKKQNF